MNNDEFLNKVVSLMASDDSTDAPASAIQWSKNIFRTRAVAPQKSLLTRILGALQFDLAPDAVAFGERSAVGAGERQMFFTAGEYGVDLRVAATGRSSSVRGQIIGQGFAGVTAKLSGNGTELNATLNELSEFQFAKVAAGEYSLSINNGITEIVVESISLV
jgi:hypothetical protein